MAKLAKKQKVELAVQRIVISKSNGKKMDSVVQYHSRVLDKTVSVERYRANAPTEQVVYHYTLANGKKTSITKHEKRIA